MTPPYAIALAAAVVMTSVVSSAAAQGVATPGRSEAPKALDCEVAHPCADVLPGAVRFEPAGDKPYSTGFDGDGERVGWVALSNQIVDVKGYSSKPLSTLVGLGPDGRVTGGRVVHHSEPILLVGIPEQKLHDFVDKHRGVHVEQRVVVGGDAGPGGLSVDMVSGREPHHPGHGASAGRGGRCARPERRDAG